jgi:hypothetical protein
MATDLFSTVDDKNRAADRLALAAELRNGIAHFTGTDQWYRHSPSRMLYTDGVRYVAERAGAYWLIDAIASHQLSPGVRREPFQVWTLKNHGSTGCCRQTMATATDWHGNASSIPTSRWTKSRFTSSRASSA